MESIRNILRTFAKDREWEQFHSPKNLAMALSVEASEILENFQWLTQEESHNLDPEKLEKVKQEIADVLIYLIRLSDKLGINPLEAAKEKIELNELRYPKDKVKGSSKKYYEI